MDCSTGGTSREQISTASGQRVLALTAVGDAFVRKTFRPTELVTAIEAAGRRPSETRPGATL